MCVIQTIVCTLFYILLIHKYCCILPFVQANIKDPVVRKVSRDIVKGRPEITRHLQSTFVFTVTTVDFISYCMIYFLLQVVYILPNLDELDRAVLV